MSDTNSTGKAPQKFGKARLFIGLTVALALGAAGFLTVHSGLLFSGVGALRATGAEARNVTFLPLDPITITLQDGERTRHLRFAASLEVERSAMNAVTRLMPRILDVLNSYLSALEPETLAAPGTLLRLRAQMLRRVRIVAGEDDVRDLLITEFVLN
ncbi:flagellar basal body-associated FliL family protein [Alkalilacustris brevis]|uniref:flagellar basal body-associated FliL family protein n=1 Tax=Alkalilacustris brevis TaxID=2026338 RepID=UPI000E0DF7B7|nr:flagellar basal body-associated FliL family protein [Alkalilacustris brevis]